MLFKLTYRVDNSGKLTQTNKQTNELVTQTRCFRYVLVFLFFERIYARQKKKQNKKTPGG
jgi:hypothetical protein